MVLCVCLVVLVVWCIVNVFLAIAALVLFYIKTVPTILPPGDGESVAVSKCGDSEDVDNVVVYAFAVLFVLGQICFGYCVSRLAKRVSGFSSVKAEMEPLICKA